MKHIHISELDKIDIFPDEIYKAFARVIYEDYRKRLREGENLPKEATIRLDKKIGA